MRKYTSREEYEKLIFESLTEFPVPIKDLSVKLDKPKFTLSKHLELLHARNMIDMAKIGNAKCYFIKKVKTD